MVVEMKRAGAMVLQVVVEGRREIEDIGGRVAAELDSHGSGAGVDGQQVSAERAIVVRASGAEVAAEGVVVHGGKKAAIAGSLQEHALAKDRRTVRRHISAVGGRGDKGAGVHQRVVVNGAIKRRGLYEDALAEDGGAAGPDTGAMA